MHPANALDRRNFLKAAAATSYVTAASLAWSLPRRSHHSDAFQLVAKADRDRILAAGARYISLAPLTITAFPTKRSAGGPHDFYSQADYFWPNPKDPTGPYINRDGQSNPENFDEHRKVMVAGIDRGLASHRGQPLWPADLRSSTRLVCHSRNADEPQPDVRSSGSGGINRPLLRHY